MINDNLPLIAILVCFGAVFAASIILKISHPLKNAIKSGILGMASLLCCNAAAIFLGVKLPINLITVAAAIVLGIPGIGTAAILNTILV